MIKKMLLLWILPVGMSMNAFGQSAPAGAGEDLKAMQAALAAVVQALPKDSPWLKTPYVGYVVPALSAVRRLPDRLPPDGKLDARITVVAAQGEYEPASFVLAPLADVAKLEVKASALTGAKGTIPAENVEIKVVKCWWQSGTAWHSYFGDPTRRELVPELLLNDDTLVKVDLENREHYLRVDYPDGPQYVWISFQYPRSPRIAAGNRFDYYQEPVADSPVLLPVKLEAGRVQQFWVTVRVPEKAAAGVYEGRITLTADGVPAGELALQVRALPFTLPDPKTYYDLERDFFVSMDRLSSLEIEMSGFGPERRDLAEQRLRALFRNQRAHNIYQYSEGFVSVQDLSAALADAGKRDLLVRNLELVKEAGFKPPLIGVLRSAGSAVLPPDKNESAYRQYIQGAGEFLDIMERTLGHREVYAWGSGEPGKKTLLAELAGWKDLHAIGVKIGSEAKPWHFAVAGYAEDLVNLGGQDLLREYTAPWHALGHRVISYANPHPGAENPDLVRRAHGMMLYKAWFDGTKNNTWNSVRENWLEFWCPYGYRIRMIYPTRNGVIDTIAWEGFREGIDDIRYATKLKLLAAKAIAGGKADAVEAAKKALLWLELHDEKSADLNTMRLEMISYILQLNAMAM